MTTRTIDDKAPVSELLLGFNSDDEKNSGIVQAFEQGRKVAVTVYRIHKDGKDAMMFVAAPDQFADLLELEQSVQANHGGGDYVAKLTVSGTLKGNHYFRVESPAGTESSTEPTQRAAAPAQGGANDVMRLMIESQQRADERYTRLLETLVGRQPQSQGGTPLEMVQAMAAMKQLAPPTPKAPDPIAELLRIKELEKALRGEVEPSGPVDDNQVMMSAIRSVTDILGPLLAQRAQAQPPQQQPSRQRVTQQPSPQSQGQEAAAANDAPDFEQVKEQALALIRASMPGLIRSAERNAYADSYGQVIADKLLEAGIDAAFVEWFEANSDGVAQSLIAEFPAIMVHDEWFSSFFAALVDEVRVLTNEDFAAESDGLTETPPADDPAPDSTTASPPDQNGQDSQRESGRAGDAAPHGEADKELPQES